jgi:hypothetical protein
VCPLLAGIGQVSRPSTNADSADLGVVHQEIVLFDTDQP